MGTPIVAVRTRAGKPSMKKFSRAARLREKLPLAPKPEKHFTWRGQEVSRLEGLADAVFGFAVTLLVISLEVPRTTQALRDALQGFPAFALCFGILMAFWNAHYRYFRRFGLQDRTTRLTTMAILVLVLFFVYPLKFLFTLITARNFGLMMHDAPTVSSPDDVLFLYVTFGMGFAGIWALRAWYGRFVDQALRALPFDANNFLIIIAIAVGAGLVAGLYPAWRIGRAAPASYLKVQ